jgi:hypothetical protein
LCKKDSTQANIPQNKQDEGNKDSEPIINHTERQHLVSVRQMYSSSLGARAKYSRRGNSQASRAISSSQSHLHYDRLITVIGAASCDALRCGLFAVGVLFGSLLAHIHQ